MDTRNILISLDICCQHDWDIMYKKISNKDTAILEDDNVNILVESELYALFHKGYLVVTIIDEEYPKELLHSSKPPFVIYYKGPIDTIKDRYSYKLPEANPDRMFID